MLLGWSMVTERLHPLQAAGITAVFVGIAMLVANIGPVGRHCDWRRQVLDGRVTYARDDATPRSRRPTAHQSATTNVVAGYT